MRRPSGSLLVSIALHILLGAALLWLLSMPYPFHEWLPRKSPYESKPEERINYVEVPSGGAPGRAGSEGGPAAAPRPAPPLVAPREVPARVPRAAPAAPEAPPAAGGAAGRGAGGTGLRQGITPSFEDSRVWLPPGNAPSQPQSLSDSLDSAIGSALRIHQDSMRALAAAQGRKPGDWTFEKGGKKWGMDSKKIYIGDVSIPTAILALLPLNAGTNPIKNREERQLNFQRKEILEQAQRAMNEEEFREAVKRIRERKQREHDAEKSRKTIAEKPIP